MWISHLICHMSHHLSNKFCHHEQINKKLQETLGKHVARSFEGMTAAHCICLLRFAVSEALSKTVT